MTKYSISNRNLNKPRNSHQNSNTTKNKLFINSCATFSGMVNNYKSERRLNDLNGLVESRSSMNIKAHSSRQMYDNITNFKKKSVAIPRDEKLRFFNRSRTHIPNQNDLENNNQLKIETDCSRDILKKATIGVFSDEEISEVSDEEILETKKNQAKKPKKESVYELPKKYKKKPLCEQGLQIFAKGLKKMIARTYENVVITNEVLNKIFIKPVESFREFIEDKNMILQQRQVFADILGTENEGIDGQGWLNNLSPDKEKCDSPKKKTFRVKNTKSLPRKQNTNKGPQK